MGIKKGSANKDFDRLFNLFYPPLVIFAHKYINNIHQCEGIVQEVFVKYWINVHPQIHSKSNFNVKSYLYRSVYNGCIDYVRHSAREQKRIRDYNYFNKDFENIKDLVAESELKIQIEKAVNKLPEQCRKIFLMSRDDEMTYKEIAFKLEISVKTVEAQVGKALKVLRKHLLNLTIVFFLYFKIDK